MKRAFILILLSLLANHINAQVLLQADAPEIRLPDSLGKWTLLSEVKADIILVDFWAAWCPPCIVAMPELKKIKNEYANNPFQVFAVSLDRDYRKWVEMERKLELPFIHVNDAYGLKSPRCVAYGVNSIPRKFLIKEGKIIAINPSFEQIRTILKQEFKLD